MADPSVNGRYRTARQRRRTSARRFELYNTFWDEGTARGLTPTAALSWLALYRHARPDRTVRVSLSRLAEMVGADRVTVARSVKRLRDAKLLVCVRRGGPDGTPTTYKIRPYDPDRPSEI